MLANLGDFGRVAVDLVEGVATGRLRGAGVQVLRATLEHLQHMHDTVDFARAALWRELAAFGKPAG